MRDTARVRLCRTCGTIVAFAAAAVASASAAPSPSPSASAAAAPAPTFATAVPPPDPAWFGLPAEFYLAVLVWVTTLGAVVVGYAMFSRTLKRASADPLPSASSDRDVDMARIAYGFWLVIGGLLLTLGVVIVTMYHFRQTTDVSEIVAIVTAVTGVIGTLTAAFFGIQAAGAGQAQALSALNRMQSQNVTSPQLSMTPSAGLHAGNTVVTIKGDNLSGATAVNFGAKPGTDLKVVNDGLINVTTPPLALDTNATTQKGRSDVEVYVVFPPGKPNLHVGTFYYYTVDASKGAAFLTIWGSGLAGAAKVRFNSTEVDVAGSNQVKLQVDVTKLKNLGIWGKEVEIAIVYAADTSAKVTVLGRFPIPNDPATA